MATLIRAVRCRGFCSSSSAAAAATATDKIVASVLFERLPVVIPKIDPVVYAFQEFSFRWRQQYRRKYPDEVLGKADARGKGDYQMDYEPAPRITEADKANDRRSLQRALDRRLYLLLYGNSHSSDGKPVWHFPEKVYENEETLRKCAVCFEICTWRPSSYLLCRQCPFCSHDYKAFGGITKYS